MHEALAPSARGTCHTRQRGLTVHDRPRSKPDGASRRSLSPIPTANDIIVVTIGSDWTGMDRNPMESVQTLPECHSVRI